MPISRHAFRSTRVQYPITGMSCERGDFVKGEKEVTDLALVIE